MLRLETSELFNMFFILLTPISLFNQIIFNVSNISWKTTCLCIMS